MSPASMQLAGLPTARTPSLGLGSTSPRSRVVRSVGKIVTYTVIPVRALVASLRGRREAWLQSPAPPGRATLPPPRSTEPGAGHMHQV